MMPFCKPVVLCVLLAWSAASPAADPSVLFDAAVRERALTMSAAVESGRIHEVMESLDALSVDPALTPAQRDATAWDLVRRLRRLSGGQVPVELIDRLGRWAPQSFQRHQESPTWQMPLFDVARAARGLDNQWTFSAGVRDATGQGSDPREWSGRYLAEMDQPYGRGVRAGLMQAPAWQLDKLLLFVSEATELRQALLPDLLLARGDLSPLAELLIDSPDVRVSRVLAQAQHGLEPADFIELGTLLLEHPNASVRSLVMARQTDAWLALDSWPADWAQSLWQFRNNPENAVTADLQLVRIGAPARWLADPSSAPPGALQTAAFDRLRVLTESLQIDAGGAR